MDGVDRGGIAVGHRDALTGSETVELDDDRPPEFAPPGDRGVVVVERGEPRSGDAERRGQLARVRLGRLELGEFGGRPEAWNPTTSALVGDTGGQRGLGAGKHQVGVVGRGGAEIRREPHVVAVMAASPGDGLLAPAPADHQNPHQRRNPNASVRSREHFHLWEVKSFTRSLEPVMRGRLRRRTWLGRRRRGSGTCP